MFCNNTFLICRQVHVSRRGNIYNKKNYGCACVGMIMFVPYEADTICDFFSGLYLRLKMQQLEKLSWKYFAPVPFWIWSKNRNKDRIFLKFRRTLKWFKLWEFLFTNIASSIENMLCCPTHTNTQGCKHVMASTQRYAEGVLTCIHDLWPSICSARCNTRMLCFVVFSVVAGFVCVWNIVLLCLQAN